MSDMLADHIARMRALGSFASSVATHGASKVEAAAKRTAAAGTDPYGKSWPARKEGGRALANAAAAISVVVSGLRVLLRLAKPEAYHQTSKSHPRKILPDGALPLGLAKALRDAARQEWQRRGFH